MNTFSSIERRRSSRTKRADRASKASSTKATSTPGIASKTRSFLSGILTIVSYKKSEEAVPQEIEMKPMRGSALHAPEQQIESDPQEIEMKPMGLSAINFTQDSIVPVEAKPINVPGIGPNATKAFREEQALIQDVLLADPISIEDVDMPLLKADMKDGSHFRKDLDGNLAPLTNSEKKEVLMALKLVGFSFAEAIKQYSVQKPGVVWAIRQYEMELTNKFVNSIEDDRNLEGDSGEIDALSSGSVNLKSDNDYTIISSNQSKTVRGLNNMFRELFQREPGTVFDTNFYSSHIALKKGIMFKEPEVRKAWLKSNEISSKIKLALFYSNGSESKSDKFEDTTFFKEMVTPIIASIETSSLDRVAKDIEIAQVTSSYEIAWESMLTREASIAEEIAQVTLEAQAEIAVLKDKPSNPSNKTRILQLQLKLSDAENLKMEAMNNLYHTGLDLVEVKYTEYLESDARFNLKLDNISQKSGIDKTELLNMVKTFDVEELKALDISPEDAALLIMLCRDAESLALETVELQSKALLYASEPYFSQSSVVTVVAGLQMAGKLAANLATLVGDREEGPVLKANLNNLLIAHGKETISDDIFLEWQSSLDPTTITAKDTKGLAQLIIEDDYPALKEKDIYLHTATENFGDLHKDFTHYSKSPRQFLFRGSKYLSRALDSLETFVKDGETKVDLKQLESFKNLSTDLLVMRGSEGDIVEEKALNLVKSFFDFGKEVTPDVVANKLMTHTRDLLIAVQSR
jgi:hypothetical protein